MRAGISGDISSRSHRRQLFTRFITVAPVGAPSHARLVGPTHYLPSLTRGGAHSVMEEPPLLHHAPLLLEAFVLAQATDFYGATGRGVAAASLSLSLSASSFDVITSSAKKVAARQPGNTSRRPSGGPGRWTLPRKTSERPHRPDSIPYPMTGVLWALGKGTLGFPASPLTTTRWPTTRGELTWT